jgi:hypothetical protein
MKEGQEKEIQIAWEIYNRLNRLSDLLWERYEDPFIEIYLQEEQEKSLPTIGLPGQEQTDPSG